MFTLLTGIFPIVQKCILKKIRIGSELKEIEGWLKGAPEFYIKVLNVDHASKQAYEVQDQIDIDFSSRSNSSQDLSVYVMDWMPGFWYDNANILGGGVR